MENPWPLAIGMAVLGLLLAGLSLQRGSTQRLGLAGAFLAGAVVVVLWSRSVLTPGERAAETVLQFVQACEQANLSLARSLVESQATFGYGSDGHDDRPRSEIDRALDSMGEQHRVEENQVTAFEAQTISDDLGRIDVTCRTSTTSSAGPISSRWIIEVQRQPDDSWLIRRILFRSLMGSVPRRGVF